MPANPPLPHWPVRFLAALARRDAGYRAAARLNEMDDALLADIGLTRDDARIRRWRRR